MTDPLISVIIPTFNGVRWLRECLDSVVRQSYRSTEIIVVDDGSTDATPALLRDYEPRIQVFRQARAGIGAARNRGSARAAGTYLAFLDHDDLWHADKLARQVSQARQQALDLVYTDATEFDDAGTVQHSFFALFPGLRRPARLFDEMLLRRAIPLMSTVLVRTDFLRRHGLALFEPASGVDDLGLFLEVIAHGGRVGCIDAPLARRRLHAGNLSKLHLHRFQKRLLLYAELLQRPVFADAQRRALRRALRDAHYRVGEWHWGQGDLQCARPHFRQALALDRVGLQAGFYGACCGLPVVVALWLQRCKRGLLTWRLGSQIRNTKVRKYEITTR